MIRLVPVLMAVAACAGVDGTKRKTGPKYQAETDSWVAAVQARGGNGMWIVNRGYHGGDDFVAVTTNAKYSHATVLDLDRGVVIEAIGKGVVETPLEKYLRESHRFVLIKPKGWTPTKGKHALQRARTTVGKSYDYGGIIGLPHPSRFYCSELAVWAWGEEVDNIGAHRVIHPRHLLARGEVLFVSGRRDGRPD